MARFGSWNLDDDRLVLQRLDEQVGLTKLEHDFLRHLATRPGVTVSRRELLADVWSYSPRIRTRAIDKLVARLRGKLGEDASLISTVVGVGYRYDDPDHGLVGRSVALSELQRILLEEQWCVVVGLGGIGKTRLARATARKSGKTIWIDAAGTQSRGELTALVAEAIELEPVKADEGMVAYGLPVANAGLIIVDGADELSDEAFELIADWARLGSTFFVVTARQAPSLVPQLPLGPLTHADAATLFRRRAPSELHPSTLSDAVLRPVLELASGIPLAIELTASLARRIPLSRLAASLEDGALIERRKRTLANVIDGAAARLDPSAREVLNLLATFPGPFDLNDIEHIAGRDVLDDVEELLNGSLLLRDGERWFLFDVVRQVIRQQLSAEVWQRFVQLACQQAEELVFGTPSEDVLGRLRKGKARWLEATPRVDTADERALLALALTQHQAYFGPHRGELGWIDTLNPDELSPRLGVRVAVGQAVRTLKGDSADRALPALRSALDRALNEGDADVIVDVWTHVVNVTGMQDGVVALASEAEALQTYAETQELSPRLRAKVLDSVARSFYLTGDANRAVTVALTGMPQLGDAPLEQRVALSNIVVNGLVSLNRLDEALSFVRRQLDQVTAYEGTSSWVVLKMCEGMVLGELGRNEAAHQRFSELLPVAREHATRQLLFHTLLNCASMEPDQTMAEEHIVEARELGRRLGRAYMVGEANFSLGQLQLKRGQFALALEYLELALETCLPDDPTTYPLVSAFHALALVGNGKSREALSRLEPLPKTYEANDQTIEIVKVVAKKDALAFAEWAARFDTLSADPRLAIEYSRRWFAS
ncbi:MAG: winged helix-turn-helix domain-containing protein [Myxococcota bacterium]